MTCCEATIYPFNGSTLTIAYGAPSKAIYGLEPNVQVYINEDGEYVLNEFVEVKFNGSSIAIDFGGDQVGIVKVF